MSSQNQTILECQKNAVEKMLSLADKQDFEDDDDEFEPKTKQKKDTKQKHIKSGTDLGASLTQRKIQRWKVLILDGYTKHLLQPLLNVGDLRALGVTLIMNIKDIRQSIPDAPAIYFIQPSKENVDIICKDCLQDLYETCYINFASSISRTLLEDMANQLVATDSTNKISKICDQFLNFVCFDQTMFSIELHNALIAIESTASKEYDKTIDEIVNGLLASVLATGVIPIIAYQKSSSNNAAEQIAIKLDKKLRTMYFNQSSTMHGGFSSSMKQKRRPVLIILNRSVDYLICLQHKWTYRSLTHELFNLKLGSFEIPGPNNKAIRFEIGLEDEFWKENNTQPFEEVAQRVPAALQHHKQKLEQFNQKNGMKINEDDMLGGQMEQVMEDEKQKTNINRSAVDEAFQLSTQRKRIDMHMKIASSALEIIKSRKIDEFVAIEEKLIETGSLDSKDRATLKNLLNKSSLEGTLAEKQTAFNDMMRMLLICYSVCLPLINQDEGSSPISKSDLDQFERNLADLKASLAEETKSSVPTLKKDADDLIITDVTNVNEQKKKQPLPELAYVKQQLQAKLPQPNADSPAKSTFGFSKHFSFIGEKVKTITNNLTSGEQSFVPRTVAKIVDGIMNQKQMSDVYVYLDPKQQQPKADGIKPDPEGFGEATVFMVGGGNFFEYQNVTQLMTQQENKNKQVVYGCTDIVKGDEFLAELTVLGAK